MLHWHRKRRQGSRRSWGISCWDGSREVSRESRGRDPSGWTPCRGWDPCREGELIWEVLESMWCCVWTGVMFFGKLLTSGSWLKMMCSLTYQLLGRGDFYNPHTQGISRSVVLIDVLIFQAIYFSLLPLLCALPCATLSWQICLNSRRDKWNQSLLQHINIQCKTLCWANLSRIELLNQWYAAWLLFLLIKRRRCLMKHPKTLWRESIKCNDEMHQGPLLLHFSQYTTLVNNLIWFHMFTIGLTCVSSQQYGNPLKQTFSADVVYDLHLRFLLQRIPALRVLQPPLRSLLDDRICAFWIKGARVIHRRHTKDVLMMFNS